MPLLYSGNNDNDDNDDNDDNATFILRQREIFGGKRKVQAPRDKIIILHYLDLLLG